MKSKIFFIFTLLVCLCISFLTQAQALEKVRGIYLSQSTLEDTPHLNYLIKNAKRVGINTFVIDLNRMTKKYQENITLVTDNDIDYVVRIVMFPGGGTDAQVKSLAYREKKYQLIQAALDAGADAVQLDYIRYAASQSPSEKNAQNIHQVIAWFKQKLDKENIPLQIDVFGISSFKPSRSIGQNIGLFANSIDALCPMLYPSHYEPYKHHSFQPYKTVLESLNSIKKQLNYKVPFRIYAYIEAYNFRYQFSSANRIAYLNEQIRATEDAGIDGWYVWSANNRYDKLFTLLSQLPKKPVFTASLANTLKA